MRADLLIQLADLLEANAANPQGLSFDYADFGYVRDTKVPVGMDCNTHACAMGLAAISGQFPRLGIKTYPGCPGISITLNGEESDGFVAAARVFDISIDDSSFLFANVPMPGRRGANAERRVAQVIRWFAEGKSPGEIMTAMGY